MICALFVWEVWYMYMPTTSCSPYVITTLKVATTCYMSTDNNTVKLTSRFSPLGQNSFFIFTNILQPRIIKARPLHCYGYAKKLSFFKFFFIYLFFFSFILPCLENRTACIYSSQWSILVVLEPGFICMWVTCSTIVLRMLTTLYNYLEKALLCFKP